MYIAISFYCCALQVARANALQAQEAGDLTAVGVYTAEANMIEAELDGLLAQAGVDSKGADSNDEAARLLRLNAEEPVAKLERLVAEKAVRVFTLSSKAFLYSLGHYPSQEARGQEHLAGEQHDERALAVHAERVQYIEDKLDKLMEQAAIETAQLNSRSQHDKNLQQEKLRQLRAAKAVDQNCFLYLFFFFLSHPLCVLRYQIVCCSLYFM
jgi:hypothetical protein